MVDWTMLDPTKLKKAESAFQNLVELPSHQRGVLVAEQCDGDGEIRAFVEQLLAHDDSGMAGFLGAPAGIPASRWPHDVQAGSPAHIGAFRLLRRVGEGGMGVVYEAEQANPQRTVALKVIRGGRFIDDYAIKLFHRETQALARLRHPCVGAIYEAGQTDDGQHFFAMEFVQGRPLLDYVREKQLDRRDRLELFRRICDAIHYAHQRGVMHRDLKPTNILVDDDGNPKILDFGLARITDAEIGVATLETAPGRIQGTLPYMSPEQARGDRDEIDIRSDIYSLGVILYELLTDRLPYEVNGLPLPRSVDVICSQAPGKSGELKGDLETITLKALEKEPPRRYAGAAALAEDIQRYLSNQPILARPATAEYQLRKFVARHKAGCAFAGVLLGVIVGFGIWMAVLQGQQRRERVRAERAATQAETVVALLTEMLGAANPDNLHDRDYTVRELLDDFAAGVWPQLENEPQVNATLRLTIGNAYLGLGEFETAEIHVQRALDLRQGVFGDEHPAVAEAIYRLARVAFFRGDYALSAARAQTALDMQRRGLGADDPALADSLVHLGTLADTKGNDDEAERLFQEALTIRSRRFGEFHWAAAECLHKLGTLHQHRGDLVGADRYYRRALEIREASSGSSHPDTAEVQFDLASLLQALGDDESAERLFRESLATVEKHFGKDHPTVAWCRTGLAKLLVSRGSLVEAETLFREALITGESRLGRDHAAVAIIKSNLGNLLREKGDFIEAERLHLEAIETQRRQLGPRSQSLGTLLTSLGQLYVAMNRIDDAAQLFEEALEIHRAMHGDQPHLRMAMILSGYAQVALNRNDVAQAETYFTQAYDTYQSVLGENHRTTLTAMMNLVDLYESTGRFAEAEAMSAAAVERGRLELTSTDWITGEFRRGHGLALLNLERYAEAEQELLEALRIIEAAWGPQHSRSTKIIGHLIDLYQAWDAVDPGLGHADKAAEFRTQLNASADVEEPRP